MHKQPIPPLLKTQQKIANKLVFSKLQERMGGRLKFFVSGGAPLAKEIAEFFHAAGILILEGYGLTETSPVLTCNTPENFRFGTVGKIIPSVQIKLSEPDHEILAKGPNVMLGYYNLPEETKAAIDEDGWFHTGDVGEWDADGFLKITDRLKDLIKTSGGKYVAPQHIEGMLIQDKFVEQACVIGDRRKYCTVLIVPSFDQLEKWAQDNGIKYTDRKDIISKPEVVKLIKKAMDEVNKDLASYESIKDFRILPEEFTQENNMITPTLKVRRKIVNKFYADLIDSMYPKE
jgi:long-chain acyl-CoA synthetase